MKTKNYSHYYVDLDHNSYFVEDTENDFYGFWGESGNYDSFPNWQTATELDDNSNLKDVSFVDESNHDLHLVISAYNDSTLYGISLACFGEDIDGDFRFIPFKGADELYPPVSAPQNVHIYYDGSDIVIEWDYEQDILYKVYESDEPDADFPSGWTMIWAAHQNVCYYSPDIETTKFFRVTASN